MSVSGFDQHTNFAYSTVQSGSGVIGSSSATTLVIAGAGDLPDPALGQYNVVVWPASLQPLSSNAEIMRVTAKSGTTLTVTRAQEGTTALSSIAAGHQVAQNITRKWFTDLEAVIPNPAFTISTQLAHQPWPGQSMSFTYASSPAADSGHPDSGGTHLNDGSVNYNGTGISGNQALAVWDSLTGLVSSPPIGPGYTAPTWVNSDYGPMWQNADPAITLDLGTAKLPSLGIFWWANINTSQGVAAPNHAKLQSADDSAMSVNVATIVDVAFSGITATSIWVGFLRVPQSSTPRRYWRMTLTHSAQWTSVSEIAVV